MHAFNTNKSTWSSSYTWCSKLGVWLNIQTFTSALKCFFATSPFLSLPDDAVFSLSVGTSSWGGPSSEIEGDRALTGYEAPWRGERDRGRRPPQCICPGESRKTSERFRMQPIASAERQETDRYCSGLMHGSNWRMQENIHMIMHVKEIIM